MSDSMLLLKRELDSKLSEISSKEREIATLTTDIQQLKSSGSDKDIEVKCIEKMLDEIYAEFRRQYPIDKGQEPEISRFVSWMNYEVSSVSSSYESNINAEYNSMRFLRFSNMRDPKMTPYKNRMRDMVKSYIEELKRLFDDVDSSTNRFYSRGISLLNMQSLICVMEKIWDKGKSVTITINSQHVASGSMPIRYKSKIDKWKTTARDIPEDMESKDREREASAKKTAQDNLRRTRSDIKKLEKKLPSLQVDLTKQERELEQLKSDLEITAAQYEPSKTAIIRNFDSIKQNIQNQIEELRKKITDLQAQKQELELALAKTFALAFGKKKELKEQIASTKSAISLTESDEHKKQLELTEEENKKNKQIGELDSKLADLRKKVKNAKVLPPATKREIESTKSSLDSKKKAIPELKREVDDFHANYLIRTYGSMVTDFASQILDKQKKIDQLQKCVAVLRQEANDIERRIKVVEIEEAKEAEKRAAELKIKQEAEVKAVAERASRLETEEEMRARIEAEVRAKYEAEARAQAEAETRVWTELEAKTMQEKRTSTVNAYQFNRKNPYIANKKLRDRLERNIDKLEQYFPEGKIFALDSIDSSLRETFVELYKKAGYATVDELFGAYGFEIISGDAVKELRDFVMYTPGSEPEFIKPKLNSMLSRLNKYYPDHIIPRGIQNDHKNLSKSISGLYQWFGYENQKSFLAAYGYEYNFGECGRPLARDYDELVNILVEKYKNGPKPKSVGELLFDNPNLNGALKTLQNKSKEVYGMTMKKYFEEVGIFATRESAGAQDDVLDALTTVYSKLDENEYGTAEDAKDCLDGMNVKRNKAGKIYIFRAVTCDSTVTIPYGIDFISNGAFSGQRCLKEVVISATLSEIPAEAFSDCISLERVEIPEGVVAIGASAFANCPSLTSVVLPKSLQQIGSRAFVNCSRLTEVEFLNHMTMVCEDAFVGCAYTYEPPKEAMATDSKYFKYSMNSNGNVTISGFNGDMEIVTIPSMIEGHLVTKIGNGAFQGCKNLVEISMSDYISTMQGDSFRNCISLKKIHLSNGISKLISTSFNGCISLKEINIPDGVTEIKKATFKDSPIERMHIGKSLVTIESKSFYNGEYDSYTRRQKTTRAINKITVDSANPYLKAEESVILSKDGKTLYVVFGNKKNVVIPEGVEVISNFAFEGLTFLSDVSLPDSLISIEEKAFAGTALRSVTFGAKVKKIGNQAFENCQNLTAAVFNNGLEEIGERAFYNSPIVSVLLPASLRELGTNAFNALAGGYYSGSGRIQEFKIDQANPYMKADGNAIYIIFEGKKTLHALYGPQYKYICDSRQASGEYTVQDGTTHIGPSAFESYQNLSKVIFPESLISIGKNAFHNCVYLKQAALPEKIESIGANAFGGTKLEEFKLGSAVREIGTGAFITDIDWNNKRTRLRNIKVDKANKTFYVENKILLKKKADGSSAVVVYFGGDEIVALPDGVSEIYSGAFMRSIVQEIQIPSSVTSIGERAFSGCSMLSRLRVGFAGPENGTNFAVIYIPETKNSWYESWDTKIREQYMDCIRADGSGTIFDFVKYDSLFETINTTKDKILIATDRLKSAIQLVPFYREKYLTYLRRNAKRAVKVVVEFDDLSGLNTLAELEVFTEKNIDDIIEFANKAKKVEMLSYLMNFKNSKIGITEEDYDL